MNIFAESNHFSFFFQCKHTVNLINEEYKLISVDRMNFLVTGAAGFIGSHLTNFLINEGHDVVALDNLEGGKREYVNPKASFLLADLRYKKSIDQIYDKIERPEVIFHLAAHAAEGQSVFNPIYTVNSNVIGFLNLFTAALNRGFGTFIFTSSMAVYGKKKMLTSWRADPKRTGIMIEKIIGFSEHQKQKPVDPYGVSKAAIERLLEIYSEEFGFNYVIIRPHNLYGPRQSLTNPYRNVFGIWMNRIMHEKPPIIYGDGEQRRAFSCIDDCTPYIAKSAWTKAAYNEIINIGSDEVHTINEACELLMEAMDYRGQVIYARKRPLEVKNAWCSQEKARKLLGYKEKTSLKEGLAKMAEWALSVGPQPFKYWDSFEIKKKVPEVWSEKML